MSRYLSFDLSTQQLKAIVIDDALQICHQVRVNFDLDLPQYRTRGGVLNGPEPNEILAPIYMWLDALELCLDKLKQDGLDFGRVTCISGCAQRHGSVWWRKGVARRLLANMNFTKTLRESLDGAFCMNKTPTWMDSSTTSECKIIEQRIGGPERLASLTGSRAIERFTGPQIAKIIGKICSVYKATDRITLISNFLSTIFTGYYTPFDVSDAAGMNLMDIRTKQWSLDCLKAVVSIKRNSNDNHLIGLLDRLGAVLAPNGTISKQNIVDSGNIVGKISGYFCKRFGFSSECLIASFVGDTPSSMAGLCVSEDELVISLGTSDSCCFWLKEPRFIKNGHMSRNPIDPDSYIGLVSFKNGSRTRERIRNKYTRFWPDEWTEFEALFSKSQQGNQGNIGFYLDHKEIYPPCRGDYRFDYSDRLIRSFSPEIEVRACLEGQFMRLFNNLELDPRRRRHFKRILVTGGASCNVAILSVISDIFATKVYQVEMPNSACLGAAYLAKCAYFKHSQQVDTSRDRCSVFDRCIRFGRTTLPEIHHSSILLLDNGHPREVKNVFVPRDLSNVYENLLIRYKKLENLIGSNFPDRS